MIESTVNLIVQKGSWGWYITSNDPKYRGLLVVGDSRKEALSEVDGAINELDKAIRLYRKTA